MHRFTRRITFRLTLLLTAGLFLAGCIDEESFGLRSSSSLDNTDAPVVSVLVPGNNGAYTTQKAEVEIAGTADDEDGIKEVRWRSNRGGDGRALGGETWRIPGIPLVEGDNLITIVAEDTTGDSSSETVIIYYEPNGTAPESTTDSGDGSGGESSTSPTGDGYIDDGWTDSGWTYDGWSDDGSTDSTSTDGTSTDGTSTDDGSSGTSTLTISGSPSSAASVNQTWSFTPNVSGADGATLQFSISQRPSWASFDSATGRLQGTPGIADTGSYTGITITVSDGSRQDTLGPFSIQVSDGSTRNVTLEWQQPTENEDGTPLTDLAGVRIYYGTSSGEYSGDYDHVVDLPGTHLTSYVIEDLEPGTWYFSAKAYRSSGSESTFASEVSTQLD